jgi:hypothetical protein
METYWQAEIYKGEEVYDADFPQRATADEALWDARERMTTFSMRELRSFSGGASEWIDDGNGMATNTGRTVDL